MLRERQRPGTHQERTGVDGGSRGIPRGNRPEEAKPATHATTNAQLQRIDVSDAIGPSASPVGSTDADVPAATATVEPLQPAAILAATAVLLAAATAAACDYPGMACRAVQASVAQAAGLLPASMRVPGFIRFSCRYS